MFTAVVTAVDLAVLVADKHYVGIMRMEQNGPDRQAVVWHIDLLPMVTAVVAAIRPGLGAGIDHLRFLRVPRQGTHCRRLGQTALQRFPFVAAVGRAEETGMHHSAASRFAR